MDCDLGSKYFDEYFVPAYFYTSCNLCIHYGHSEESIERKLRTSQEGKLRLSWSLANRAYPYDFDQYGDDTCYDDHSDCGNKEAC